MSRFVVKEDGERILPNFASAAKKGQQLTIPSETLLEFRLQPAPLPVSA